MKVCNNEPKRENTTPGYPTVKRGDLVHLTTSLRDEGLYLVTKALSDDAWRLYNIETGAVWSTISLWGETVGVSKVTLVTDKYCLKKVE